MKPNAQIRSRNGTPFKGRMPITPTDIAGAWSGIASVTIAKTVIARPDARPDRTDEALP